MRDLAFFFPVFLAGFFACFLGSSGGGDSVESLSSLPQLVFKRLIQWSGGDDGIFFSGMENLAAFFCGLSIELGTFNLAFRFLGCDEAVLC